jgi:hypothetical protein
LKPVNIEIIEIMTFPLDLELRVIKWSDISHVYCFKQTRAVPKRHCTVCLAILLHFINSLQDKDIFFLFFLFMWMSCTIWNNTWESCVKWKYSRRNFNIYKVLIITENSFINEFSIELRKIRDINLFSPDKTSIDKRQSKT